MIMVYLYMPDQTSLILYFRKKQITPNLGGIFFPYRSAGAARKLLTVRNETSEIKSYTSNLFLND